MSITEIMEWNLQKNQKERLTLMIGMHCAPLLMRSKISNIMTIDKCDFAGIRNILQETDISYRLLKARDNKLILFLYREQDFIFYLSQPDVHEFLIRLGYEAKIDPMHLLNQLAKRIFFYGNGEIAFPHEIGIFLGYPLCDVKGFMEHLGQNSLYSGYWKVYENVENTKALFLQFEEEKEAVVHKIISGYTLKELLDEESEISKVG
ncbi:MAG: DUF3793 family protein [Lachnospiraceae bacterium]|nr:DUF3793 family protein [Lachnospiraceae bacterium]